MKKLTFLLLICYNCVLSQILFSQEIALGTMKPTSWAWGSSDIAPSINVPENIKLNTSEWSKATCFCKVSYNNLTNQQAGTGICLDLTGVVNKIYSGPTPMSETNRNDCNQRCTGVTAALTAAQKQSIADCVCAAGVANGTPIRSYSAVGTKDYKSSQQLGILTNTAEVTKTTCTCPNGWTPNAPTQNNGETTDGKCKKVVCQPNTVTPLPANGTAIGTWGFTWGDAFIAWGTPANGGGVVCNTTVVTPKVCKIQ